MGILHWWLPCLTIWQHYLSHIYKKFQICRNRINWHVTIDTFLKKKTTTKNIKSTTQATSAFSKKIIKYIKKKHIITGLTRHKQEAIYIIEKLFPFFFYCHNCFSTWLYIPSLNEIYIVISGLNIEDVLRVSWTLLDLVQWLEKERCFKFNIQDIKKNCNFNKSSLGKLFINVYLN